MKSFIFNGNGAAECKDVLCEDSYSKLPNESSYFTIPNFEEYNKATNGAAP